MEHFTGKVEFDVRGVTEAEHADFDSLEQRLR
jgi:hypothetical protein